MTQQEQNMLFSLLGTSGVSAFEGEISRLFAQHLSSVADEVFTDHWHNVVGVVNAQGSVDVMLSAHMDQIGLQVTALTSEGMLRVRSVGGVKPINMLNKPVLVHTKNGVLQGVIVGTAKGDNNRVPDIDDLLVDIDAAGREQAMGLVEVGDVVSYCPRPHIAGDVLTSAAVDDRIGCYIALRVARQLKNKLHNVRLLVAGTTQEEIGLRGMAAVAQNMKPEVCVNIDVTDALQADKKDLPLLGEGPVVYLNADTCEDVRQSLLEAAGRLNIKIQKAVGRHVTGGTDGSRMQIFSPRTRTGEVAIACKYMHSDIEKCSLGDVQAVVNILCEYVLSLD